MPKFLLLLLPLACQYNLVAQDFTSTGSLTFTNSGIFTTDLNKDSFPDILFMKNGDSDQDPSIVVRAINVGEESLAFTITETPTRNAIFGSPTAADFDQDGNVDLIFSEKEENQLVLFSADEMGVLTETALPVESAGFLAAANLNGDSLPDLVGINFSKQEVVVFLNGNGDSTRFTRAIIYNTDVRPYSIHVVDIDGDGDDDVVIGTDDFTEESLILMINDGTGTFSTQLIESTGNEVRSVECISSGDFNEDGRVDLIVVARRGCYTYRQREDGSFSRKREFRSGSTFRSVEVGDFNGDGKDDFVLGDNSNFGVNLYLNDGMATPGYTESNIAGIRPAFTLQAQDLNRDGDLDLVASNGRVYALENGLEQVSPVSTPSILLQEASIFPNPVGEDFLYLEGESLTVASSYELMNGSGRLVASGKLDRNGKINVKALPSGLYVLHLYAGNRLWGAAKVIRK